MFKKPFGNLKTSVPLHGSDRRKFKQRVVAAFGVSQDEGDQLVPEGLESIKFSTRLNQQGVAYLGPEGDPLWFTIGKDSDELIPTIYTLWKKQDLVPFVSTPPSVIPVLVGGADLIIRGVIQRPSQPIAKDQLVSVCQYDRKAEKLSAPLVVGRMAIASDQMAGDGNRKAVFVLHAWNDHLLDMGSKPDVPEPSVVAEATREEGEDSGPQEPSTLEQEQEQLSPTQTSSSPHTTTIASYLSLQEVTDILHKSLLQSISTILPVSPFPILSTQFYTNYILPCRPATTTSDDTIKNSTHKSLTAFLKAAEKASLLTLKSPQKHLQQKDLLVMSANKTHPSVLGHVNYKTLKDKRRRRQINKNDKAYTNLDDLLRTCIYAKQQSKPAMAGNTNASLLESEPIKREELVKKVIAKMQDWYEIVRNGETSQKEVVHETCDKSSLIILNPWHCRQGTLKLIQVLTTPRGRKKALTFVTGFEPFVTVGAETMADELKRNCASAASVSPLPGTGMKVMVQGKQSKAVLEFLTSHGVPKQWIELRHPQNVRHRTKPTKPPNPCLAALATVARSGLATR
ncbi:hypothetical protein M378DRAFT_11337 [Amanita muscaria Koide BX008]|uniref:SUI1 domain-containing protein n=1 Tax=Amanita muscaria (strain Koide BX008) TaxID=946122 RepID=A0A0C2WS92_AMAMK|nr:hypothetical protein M378DRAFT_11337 [Amanita muscaria Koide BX008]